MAAYGVLRRGEAVEVRHAEVRSVEAWFGGHCVAGFGPLRSV